MGSTRTLPGETHGVEGRVYIVVIIIIVVRIQETQIENIGSVTQSQGILQGGCRGNPHEEVRVEVMAVKRGLVRIVVVILVIGRVTVVMATRSITGTSSSTSFSIR